MYDNVIIISLDTLRNDCLGAAPLRRYHDIYKDTIDLNTNFLDEIALKGTYFSNCISAAPYTGASHGAIFSGNWPLKNGLYEIYNRPITSKLIFEYFRDFGYNSVMNVEFPFIIGDYLDLKKGVDQYFVDDYYSAIKQIKEKTVAFFHFAGIHYPYGFHKYKFSGEDYTRKVEGLEQELNITKLNFSDRLVEGHYNKRDLDLLMRYKNIIRTLIDKKRYNKLFNLYLEGVEYFIQSRFEKFWKDLMGAVRNTNYLIIILSDHGEEWSDDSEGHYNSMSTGVLNVPLIFLARDIDAQIINERVRTIDVLPTILDLNKTRGVSGFDGISLVDTIRGKKTHHNLECYAQSWVATDFAKLKEVRIKMMKQNVAYTNIEHSLLKETVYYKDYKLLKQYDKAGKFKKEKFESDTAGGIDNLTKKKMRSLLEEYNKHRSLDNFNVNKNCTKDVRQMLRNFGYKV